MIETTKPKVALTGRMDLDVSEKPSPLYERHPMTSSENVIPFLRDQSNEEDFDDGTSITLGKIRRDEWELWVSLHKNGSISLKWWTWREDLHSFYPKADFEEIDLAPSELGPLGELLIAVSKDPILEEEWPL